MLNRWLHNNRISYISPPSCPLHRSTDQDTVQVNRRTHTTSDPQLPPEHIYPLWTRDEKGVGSRQRRSLAAPSDIQWMGVVRPGREAPPPRLGGSAAPDREAPPPRPPNPENSGRLIHARSFTLGMFAFKCTKTQISAPHSRESLTLPVVFNPQTVRLCSIAPNFQVGLTAWGETGFCFVKRRHPGGTLHSDCDVPDAPRPPRRRDPGRLKGAVHPKIKT